MLICAEILVAFADSLLHVWNAACLNYLVRHGPWYGYFVEMDKSYNVCQEEDKATTWEAFATLELNMNFVQGRQYIGRFIGSAATKEEWLGDIVAKWTAAAVETLAVIAMKHPHTANAGFASSLQNQWQYLQRVAAKNTGPYFVPLKVAIRTKFIPALVGVQSWEVDGGYHELLTHSIKQGGLAIHNPVDTALHIHAASKVATAHLTISLINDEVIFDLGQYLDTTQAAGQAARIACLG